MLTKIFPTGQGKSYGPVEYLCSDNPFGRGEREKVPQVISGNPALIRSQINSVPFHHKYTSGVHSFAPEDKPTDDQIMEIIEATEELAFAGLPLSSRSILWVKHEHAGRTELHFLIPRQEVNSGKSFNAFPPGWQQKYDPLRDKFNYKYGWARPEDPERARHWQPGINAKIMQDAKRKGRLNPRTEVFSLTDDLANMAIQGRLASRSDIVSELKKRGYGINRQGKDYLTIIDRDGKKTRLKGTLFEESFNGPDWIKAQLVKINKPDSEKILIDQKLAEEADAKLQEAIRKTAQYNISRYSLKEEENEQSAGKQPIAKSEIDQRNLGSGHEGYSGKSTSFQESIDGERDESHALYAESGLGENVPDRSVNDSLRGNAGYPLQASQISDPSFASLGGAMGTRSEMAESHRRTAKGIYEWGNKYSQDGFGAGTGDYRGQPGKPGRHDEADNGQFERTARQGFQFGELVQNFRSLKKDTEKLEVKLSRLNQVDKKLNDFELDLRPDAENLDKIASEAISALRQANERRLLQKILRERDSIAKIDTGNLLIAGNEAVKWLRAENEQKLFQKLAKSGTSLSVPALEEFALLGNAAQHHLATACDIRIGAEFGKELSNICVPDLGSLMHVAKQVYPALRIAADFRRLEQLNRIPPSFEAPPLQILAPNGKMACDSLRQANDFAILGRFNRYQVALVLPDTARFGAQARFALKRLKTSLGTSVVAKIYKAERQRIKIIKNCYLSAEWAGSDLERWDRVFIEYKKDPKRLKVLNELINEAHSRFLGIMVETRNLGAIEDRCAGNPFLIREFAILKEIWEEEVGLNEVVSEEVEEEIEIKRMPSEGPK